MRHAVAGFKLNVDSDHRRALLRNMAIAVFTHGQITTTHIKAKAVRPLVEKLITLAKKGDLPARRRVQSYLGNPILVDKPIDWDNPPTKADGYIVNASKEKLIHGPRVVSKLFKEIAPTYADRAGGYTRIVKLGRHRIGDAADLVLLQLVGKEEPGAPNIKGRYSRRRQKQDKRTVFAAKLRKAATPKPSAEAAAAQ